MSLLYNNANQLHISPSSWGSLALLGHQSMELSSLCYIAASCWVGAGVCVSTLVSQFLIVYSLCEPPALLRFKGGVCFSPGPINRNQATKKLFLPPADDDVIIKRAGESGSGQEQNHWARQNYVPHLPDSVLMRKVCLPQGFHSGSVVKNLPANAGHMDSIRGLGKSPGGSR